jgi:hypothetical protein
MDFSDRIPNIAALLRQLGGGSYDKLNRQVHGLMPCGTKRAKAIEAATGGAVRAVWLLGLEDPPAPDHNQSSKAVA